MTLVLLLPLFALAQGRITTDTIVHSARVKLIKAEHLPAHCGIFAWALAQQFEVVECDFVALKPKYKILLIQGCPEFLGADFFLTGQTYDVKFAEKSLSGIDYLVLNEYKHKNLLTFWITQIKVSRNF